MLTKEVKNDNYRFTYCFYNKHNSLYIILFSQTANLITTLISGAPTVEWHALVFMIAGGISGAVISIIINRKISSKAVDRLFTAFMSLVIFISIYNALKFVP